MTAPPSVCWVAGLAVGLASAACSGEVFLGDTVDGSATPGTPDAVAIAAADAAPPDAGEADGNWNRVLPGEYWLDFQDQSLIECFDELEGMESQFTQPPQDQGLADGMVTIAVIGQELVLSGDVASNSFGVPSITLRRGVIPTQPPTSFLGVFAFPGAGPLGTQRTVGAIGINGGGARPWLVTAQAGAAFGQPMGSGTCTVTFAVELRR